MSRGISRDQWHHLHPNNHPSDHYYCQHITYWNSHVKPYKRQIWLQLKWDPLITYVPGSDKNSIIIFLSVIFLFSCFINHTTNLGSIHYTLHPLLTIIANIGPVIIIIMILSSIVITIIFIIILYEHHDHMFSLWKWSGGKPNLSERPTLPWPYPQLAAQRLRLVMMTIMMVMIVMMTMIVIMIIMTVALTDMTK